MSKLFRISEPWVVKVSAFGIARVEVDRIWRSAGMLFGAQSYSLPPGAEAPRYPNLTRRGFF